MHRRSRIRLLIRRLKFRYYNSRHYQRRVDRSTAAYYEDHH